MSSEAPEAPEAPLSRGEKSEVNALGKAIRSVVLPNTARQNETLVKAFPDVEALKRQDRRNLLWLIVSLVALELEHGLQLAEEASGQEDGVLSDLLLVLAVVLAVATAGYLFFFYRYVASRYARVERLRALYYSWLQVNVVTDLEEGVKRSQTVASRYYGVLLILAGLAFLVELVLSLDTPVAIITSALRLLNVIGLAAGLQSAAQAGLDFEEDLVSLNSILEIPENLARVRSGWSDLLLVSEEKMLKYSAHLNRRVDRIREEFINEKIKEGMSKSRAQKLWNSSQAALPISRDDLERYLNDTEKRDPPSGGWKKARLDFELMPPVRKGLRHYYASLVPWRARRGIRKAANSVQTRYTTFSIHGRG